MYRRILAVLALLGPLAFVLARTPTRPQPRLVVGAAASMKDVLTEINRSYGPAQVTVNYGSSGALQQQISQGAPVDVFISAATRNMDALAQDSRIDIASRQDIASNRLVLIVPAGTGKNVTSFRDLARPVVSRFAMGLPDSVPAGAYAAQVIRNLRLGKEVTSKAVYCKDVRAVLTQVELGNVEAGIVYRTDALTSSKVRIASTSPTSLHLPIRYPAAAVTGRPALAAARQYILYLSSPAAQKIFQHFGFGRP